MSEPVRLRLVDSAPDDMDDWEPGMMWPLELLDEDSAGYSVVLCRHTDKAGRNWPIMWHTRQPAAGTPGARWLVTGQPPNLTVTPSINVVGVWHGWIRNGELVEV